MKAAARRPWTAGGRPGRGRARCAGRLWTGPERASQGPAAERGGRRGAGRAGAAWHRGRSGGGGATGRGRAVAAAGTGRLMPSPKGGRPFSPPSPPETNSRGRRTPPTCSWGVRRPRGGTDADPSGHDGPGRRQAPRRPHDASRPTRDLAGIRGRRRPDRGGRPLPGDGGPRRTRGPTTKGPGWAMDAARPGRDRHARVLEGGPVASGPVVHRSRGVISEADQGFRARTASGTSTGLSPVA